MNLSPERKILFSGGTRSVNYLEYLGNPGVAENWIPTRAYLNQRTLSPDGESMCNVASMAMVLAMNGVISVDRASMVAKAEAMYPGVLASNGKPHLEGVVDELERQGMTVESPYLSADNAWRQLKAEIDAGRPVIVRTPPTTLTSAGHYIVAVGYRDATGSRQIIVYDPYGRWNGTTDSYNANSKTDASSRRGQWVSYDFDLAFGKSYNLVIAQPKSGIVAALHATETPSTPPDSIGDEPENDEHYSGIQDIGAQVYLPFARR